MRKHCFIALLCLLAAGTLAQADDLSTIIRSCGKPSETRTLRDEEGWSRIIEYKSSTGAVVDISFTSNAKTGPWEYQIANYAVDKFPCLTSTGFVPAPALSAAKPTVSRLSSDSGLGVLALLLILLGISIYFMPLALALHRQCKSSGGVAVVNIFLGWTFIGWVVALAWAASGETRPKPIPAAPLP
jgi:hypothetical protein